MQDLIIAMLAISAILMIRDMAKIVFRGRKNKTSVYDGHPQKKQMEQYANSLQRLADTFYQMPSRRERLSESETEGIFERVREEVCNRCSQRCVCWNSQKELTIAGIWELLCVLEAGDDGELVRTQGAWYARCSSAGRFVECLKESFQRARSDLMWNNRQTESRLAVAEQLGEVACTIQKAASEFCSITPAPEELDGRIRKSFLRHRMVIDQIWMMETEEKRWRIYLTMRSQGGQCIAVREASAVLSAVCERSLVSARDSHTVINSQQRTILFVEDTNYRVLQGLAHVTQEAETVSGDSYAFCHGEEEFIMCLSDGMGSGLEAAGESETVVELLEQFLASGFSRETSAKLLNSALVLQRRDGMYSTVDICAVNLYTGVCECLKAGAAATFIRREQWVEVIASTSLAAGLVQQMDFETVSKKLYDGDYLIMMTDGVLDALSGENAQEEMKEIILQVNDRKPQEIGRRILQKVLVRCGGHARDDMTVLVAGIWKK